MGYGSDMSLVQWLAIAGVVLFLALLLFLGWAYATGRLKPRPNETSGSTRPAPALLDDETPRSRDLPGTRPTSR